MSILYRYWITNLKDIASKVGGYTFSLFAWNMMFLVASDRVKATE